MSLLWEGKEGAMACPLVLGEGSLAQVPEDSEPVGPPTYKHVLELEALEMQRLGPQRAEEKWDLVSCLSKANLILMVWIRYPLVSF